MSSWKEPSSNGFTISKTLNQDSRALIKLGYFRQSTITTVENYQNAMMAIESSSFSNGYRRTGIFVPVESTKLSTSDQIVYVYLPVKNHVVDWGETDVIPERNPPKCW